MEKSERWVYIFFATIFLLDIAFGQTTWATFWWCGLWVDAWMINHGMYAKIFGEMEAMNGQPKG